MSHNVNRSPPCLQKAEGNFQANTQEDFYGAPEVPLGKITFKLWP